MLATATRVEPAYLHIPEYVTTIGDEVGGLAANAGYAPDADQQAALDGIFGRLPGGKSAAFEAWIIACRQNLKPLDTATPMLAARGWTTMGEIRPGDQVYHPAGHLVRVVAVSVPEVGHDCYRVTAAGGRSVVADADHLWQVYDTRLRRDRLVTTREMAAGLDRGSPRTTTWAGRVYPVREYRYHLPSQEPLKAPDVDLPLDPYLLGAWLGDGKADAAVLFSHLDDVAHWIVEVTRAGYVPVPARRRTCWDIKIPWHGPGKGRNSRGLRWQLRRLGVLGGKHIPGVYLTAGTSQREALLQGLLDTDGTIHHRSGQVTFTSTVRDLADGVLFLARSLGWRASLAEGQAALDGRMTGPKFTVTFTPKTGDPFAPFRLSRKAARVRAGKRDRQPVSVRSVEPVVSRPVRCIQVDSPDGLFLAGRGLVATHNTAVEKMCVLGWTFLLGEDPVMWTAHEWDPAVKEAFTDLHNLISGDPWMRRRVRYVHQGDRQQEIGLKNGARIMFKTRTPGAGRALAGAKTVLDEGWAIKPSHMGALIPTMSARSMTGDPQIIGGSSAARAESEVLHGIIKRGRAAATDPRQAERERKLLYIEYCAADPAVVCERGADCSHELDVPGCGCDKPEVITAANPAIGRRIDLDFVLLSERRSMPPAEFGRERCGWHDTPEGLVKAITVDDWTNLADPLSEPHGPVALSVVYSSDKRLAKIGLAGMREDDRWHVEIARIVPVPEVVETVGQIIARADLVGEHPVCGVVVDPGGFEGECIQGLLDMRTVKVNDPDLLDRYGGQAEEADVRLLPWKASDLSWKEGNRPRLVRLSGPDVTAAFAGFYKSVATAKDLAHRGQRELLVAVERACSRDVGDAGEAWGRKKSGSDISDVVAVTNARWGYERLGPVWEPEPKVWAI